MKKTETWLWLDVRTMQSHGTSWSSLRWMMSPTFEISNMRDNTARHYCVTLIQRQSVWEMNWRLESLELSMFTLTQNVSTEKMENNCERQTLMFMLLLTLVASPWTTETSKEFARLSSLCLEWCLVFIGWYISIHMSWCAERLFLRPPPH